MTRKKGGKFSKFGCSVIVTMTVDVIATMSWVDLSLV